ncbi:flagellar biosynthesis protein FlhB [Alicyclobacillus fastidiosus]|uniref:flagellar biosynthesis protein FlhB n=1 Tax=Alicyclobacillus fastidiosus TaxID=392011 RepID=UPI0024E0CEAB|nr:flagellar biosynthesis protein FlhB [Alicyclobacillus fastidiosus]
MGQDRTCIRTGLRRGADHRQRGAGHFDESGEFIVDGAMEAVIGLLLGFIATLVFSAISIAGQAVDIQIGFSMAQLVAPGSTAQMGIMGNLYNLLFTLYFLGMGGLDGMMLAILQSFRVIHIGVFHLPSDWPGTLLHLTGLVMSMGVELAAPLLAALFLSDVTFAFLSRAVPQMNVFVVGLPVKLFAGLAMFAIVMPGTIYLFNQLFSFVFNQLQVVLQAIGVSAVVALQLQRFASGEKTERATQKRRDEARREGNVSRSPELTSALALTAILVALRVSGPMIWGSWQSLMERDFTMQIPSEWTVSAVTEMLLVQGSIAVRALLPVVGIALVIGVAVAVAQVRPMFVPKLLAPKFSRIQPIEGFKRMFSARTLVELCKSLLKLMVVGLVGYSVVVPSAARIRGFVGLDVTQLPYAVGSMVFSLGIRIAAAMVMLAFFDFLYQRFEYERGLRMTKQDVKDEMKQMEGNQEVKGVIRKRARQMAFRRMMQEVPKADVIVTNPTHFAIALRYDSTSMSAPHVVAKGADLLAQRIKARAAEVGVPMVENRPLAQTLYRVAEVGDAVPAELFQAVAEVLAYVYRLKQVPRR